MQNYKKLYIDGAFTLGEFQIDRVEEMSGPLFPPSFLPGLPEDALAREAHWLVPKHFDEHSGNLVNSDHSWVLRTGRHTILIDSCVGNYKNLPTYELFNNLETPYLERLASIGLSPDDIDFVMCTHLHVDHVGWNTRLENGIWVPTFRRARYLIGRHEYDVAERAIANGENENDRPVFNESVLPVVEAGLVEYVDDGFQIDQGVVVHAAPGHTEGHMVVHAKSNGSSGIFCGDVIHHPLQLRYPHINSMACRDPEQAANTRRAVLTDCAEHDRLLMPVHFAGSSCGHVRHDKDVYTWEELS
jgi:glyoxylase-like metal-dependent hydrolase (beta-lactamase superfamily II)